MRRRCQEADQERVTAGVVARNRRAEFPDAAGNSPGIEQRLADHASPPATPREDALDVAAREELDVHVRWCARSKRSLRFLRVLCAGFATVISM